MALTHPSVDTKTLLSSICDDIVEGSLKGFDAVDPDGTKLMLLLDSVGFLTDFSEGAMVLTS